MSDGNRIIVVDSWRGRYVEDTALEEGILGPELSVELVCVDRAEELFGRVEDVAGIISWHHIALDRELLPRLKRCRGIVRAGVGYDNVDLECAARCGIPVCNIPDYGTEEVADHTLALILGLIRRLRTVDRHCRQGGWEWRTIGAAPRIRGMQLGIVGFGRIGSAVARRAAAFGMEPAFYDPYVPSGVEKAHGVKRVESLQELLARSHILSMHVPLTQQTRGMIGARELMTLPQGSFLINTCRGPVVDQAALITALSSGHLGGAGLDVLATEPTVPEELRLMDSVLLTAHSAFYADEALVELRTKAAHCLRRLLRGERDRNVLNGGDRGPRAA